MTKSLNFRKFSFVGKIRAISKQHALIALAITSFACAIGYLLNTFLHPSQKKQIDNIGIEVVFATLSIALLVGFGKRIIIMLKKSEKSGKHNATN